MGEKRADDFSRRSFLKGTAAVSLGTAVGATSLGTAVSAAWMAPAAAAEPAPIPPHGAELRGMDLVTESPTTEGRFGFMFKSQPPHRPSDTLLGNLGQTMEEKPIIGKPLTDPLTGQPVMKDGVQVTANKDHNDALGENPNPALTSGFTFVGQFVDHDITFDQTPLDEQQSDPNATTNFRTPRYDLDAIYGRGPNHEIDRQFYDANDRDKFMTVETTYDEDKGIKGLVLTSETEANTTYYPKPPLVVRDVPRVGPEDTDGRPEGKAIIADPRNDQTLIILQLHVALQKFHNKLVDRMRALGVSPAGVFENARRMARWHYQWMVIHEFLPAIVGKATADSVYKEVENKAPIINIKYYRPRNRTGRPFIPVEFAVAAYRFGHSITRPRYTVQDVVTTSGTKAVSSVPLFEAVAGDNNLNGSRVLPPRLKIQWSKFFNDPLAKPLNPDGSVPRTARPVRQFDATLAEPLFKMPTTALPDSNPLNLLSSRNLLRGKKMGLPSGQQVARLMGVTPLTNAQLWSNHRIEVKIPIPTVEPTTFGSGPVANIVQVLREFDVENKDLRTLFENNSGWSGEAPLWFYILKEAELIGDGTEKGKGRTLGPVGGRIVAEVLVGLLQKDPNSYLYLQPNWKPQLPIARVKGTFTMADLLTYAGVWS